MGGSRAGGLKSRETHYKKYGKDWYARIGKIGGQNGTTGGFYADRELAARAGSIGGKISKPFTRKTRELKDYKLKFEELKRDGKIPKPTIGN